MDRVSLRKVGALMEQIQLLDQQLEDRFFKALLSYDKLIDLADGQLDAESFSTSQKANLFKAICFYHKEFGGLPKEDLLLLTIEEMFSTEQVALARRYLSKLEEVPVPDWEWIINRIDRVVKSIRLHKALFEGAEQLKEGNLEQAEDRVLRTIRSAGLHAPGSRDSLDLDNEEIYQIIAEEGQIATFWRIPALDRITKGVLKQQLLVIMAPLNVGKTWAVQHLCHWALMGGPNIPPCRVLYLTLETTKPVVYKRIFQMITGLLDPRHQDDFRRESEVWVDKWSKKEVVTAETLFNISLVSRKLKYLRGKGGFLKLEYYPAGECGIKEVEHQIMLFDAVHGKPPDMVIIDGLTDMKLDVNPRETRHGFATLAKSLRSIAHKYNLAMVTTHQGNRESLSAEVVGVEHTGEALAIMQTADTAISLNQTFAEYLESKMRVFIMRARGARKWIEIEMWQNLAMGQFHQASRIKKREEEADESTSSAVSDRIENRRKSFNRGKEE